MESRTLNFSPNTYMSIHRFERMRTTSTRKLGPWASGSKFRPAFIDDQPKMHSEERSHNRDTHSIREKGSACQDLGREEDKTTLGPWIRCDQDLHARILVGYAHTHTMRAHTHTYI